MFGLGGMEILLVGFVLAVVVGIPIVAYRDMIKRGKPSFAVVVAVAIFAVWPLGVALWCFGRVRFARIAAVRELTNP